MARRLFPILALLVMTLSTALHSQDRGLPVGRTEWTNPDASGRPPSANAPRILAPRVRIVEREAVNTSARGAADFFFVNLSRLLVGPTCRVVLDGRFYDPELDTEVKAFSLGTMLRCITKAENILAERPKDQIVIETPRGRIVIAGAVATVALTEDDAAPGLPQRGNPVSAPLQVTVSAVRPGGFVLLTGVDGSADNRGVIRRPGYVLWVDEFGEVRGPDRETAEKAAQLRAPLENLVSASANAQARDADPRPGFVLADPATIPAPGSNDERSVRPPRNCLVDSCSGLYISR